MSKILITGGAGFIGSQLGMRLVNENNEITLLDNMSDGHLDNVLFDGEPFAKLVFKDIRDASIESEFKEVDTIFHFAGTSSLPKCQSNPVAAYDNNVTGLINVLESARKSKVKRVIYSSTSAVYENNLDTPFKESSVVSPDLVYASSKLAGENICKAYSQTYGLDIIVARFFNVFGEHQDIHRTMPPFVSYLAKEVYFGNRPTVYNKSDAVRDYIYVGDVIEGLICMKNSSNRFEADAFNLCSGRGYSVKQIIEMYSQISKKSIDPVYKDPNTYWDQFPSLFNGLPLKHERITKEVFKNSIGCPSKTKKTFHFESKVDLMDGLKRVHDYSLKNLESK
jgi:UDP-glucose 4-epimerase